MNFTDPAASIRSSWIRSIVMRGVRVELPANIQSHQRRCSTMSMVRVRP